MSSDTASAASSGPRLCRSCRQPLPPRWCAVCGTDITDRHRHAEVCSPRCYHGLPRVKAKHRERYRRLSGTSVEGSAENSAAEEPVDDGDTLAGDESAAPVNACKKCGQPKPPRVCEQCGADISDRPGKARVCSNACYYASPDVKEAIRRRARERARTPEGKASRAAWLNRPGNRERVRATQARWTAKKRAERERTSQADG